jgi:hypothetical protein
MRAGLIILNVVGGLAVLGSYAWGILTHPGQVDALWGGVPEAWRPGYGLSMLPAAIGYLVFASYLLFRVDPSTTTFPGGLPYGALWVPFLLILLPSALWMPLTFRFVESGGEGLWIAIRVALSLVGLGSVSLLAMVAGIQPREHPVHWGFSVAGAVAFLFQTGVLDALLWTGRFRT